MIGRLSTVLICLLVIDVSAHAGKITIDPNAPGSRPEPAATAADSRLDREITYQSGCKRVHEVVDDLARTSGIRIDSGSRQSDWQVRDIPVAVAADGVPVGKLLHLIADAAHLSLASETVDEESGAPEKLYRLYRSRRASAEIAAYVNAKQEAKLAEVAWRLDVLAMIGALPEAKRSELAAKNEVAPFGLAVAGAVANLVPDAKARLMAGETVLVGFDSRRQQDALRTVYRTAMELRRATADREQMPGRAPEWGDADRVTAAMALYGDGGDMELVLRSEARGAETGTLCTIVSAASSLVEKVAKDGGIELPARPEREAVTQNKTKPLGGDYKPLATEPDWDRPALKKQISVELPNDVKDPTFADRIGALAKASAYTIVCEDFESHKLQQPDSRPAGLRTTLAEALTAFKRIDWFIDEEHHTIVGWAKEWQVRHTNLIRQSLYVRLREKLKGPGVELDDALQLLDLTHGQREEWVSDSRDLFPLGGVSFSAPALGLWKLYAALKPRDKALARSERGLALSAFDPVWLVGFLKEARKTADWSWRLESPEDLLPPTASGRESASAVLADPQCISLYAMRVETEAVIVPREGAAAPRAEAVVASADEAKKSHIYSMSLISLREDAKPAMRLGGAGSAFPIYQMSWPQPIVPAIAPVPHQVAPGDAEPPVMPAIDPAAPDGQPVRGHMGVSPAPAP